MTALAVWFMVGFPLAGFLTTFLFRKHLPAPVGGWIASISALLSFFCTLYVYTTVPSTEMVILPVFEWFKAGPISCDFYFLIDSLSLVMALMITGIGSLIHIYAVGYMKEDPRFNNFFAYFNLFVCFMLVLVLSNSYLGMFVGWEGVGLCSYLLIGFWFNDPANNKAALKAFVVNRIGDLGFLFSILVMFFYLGSTDFGEVFSNIYALSPTILFVIAIGLLIGAIGKSAQVPLFVWLPDAMAGPTPVSALIHAATMVTAGIYMIARSHILFSSAPYMSNIIVGIGLTTAVLGALFALKQSDIKKILAYSTMSQLGFMVSALGFGAYTSAIFHMVTHAGFKALLFLSAGNVIHALNGEQNIFNMGGLKKSIPITFTLFLIGTLAITGCPPFSGFFSKDSILMAAYQHSNLAFGILVGVSLLTAFYMFRLFFLTFLGQERHDKHPHEAPFSMNAPLVILSILAIFLGFINTHSMPLLDYFLSATLPISHEEAGAISSSLLIGTLILLPLIAGLTYFMYTKPDQKDSSHILSAPFSKAFYIDTVFELIFVKGFLFVSSQLNQLVALVQESIHSLAATLIASFKVPFQKIQNGNTQVYLVIMGIGLLLLLLQGLLL